MDKPESTSELLKVEACHQSSDTFITIKPPKELDGISRTPVDICCVIDVSGSMSSEAKIHAEAGKGTEGFGFSTLDLVKHALATIIQSLGGDDRLSIVTFESTANVDLKLTTMDDIGKENAMKVCKGLVPKGSTKLWDGLSTGLDVLRKNNSRTNSAILLLTDGMPDNEGVNFYQKSLTQHKENYGLPSQLHYFGFGYSMDSKLLTDLAVIGDGAYSYIPDGSFVGTVFINALANILSTVSSKLKLKISLENCKIDSAAPTLSLFNHQFLTNELVIDIGNVCFGQDRDIVLPIQYNDSKQLKISITYNSMFNEGNLTNSYDLTVQDTSDSIAPNQVGRLQTILAINEALTLANSNKIKDGYNLIENLMKKLQDTQNVKEEKYISGILYDLKEQVLLALSKTDYWKKWGSHYFYSLIRAHILQIRNNFKDPGVQNYGGKIFESLQEKIEEIFITLPPPEPSKKNTYNNKGGNNPPVLQNMGVFYNVSGGCFAGECEVLMADGTIKLVKEIRKDDLVKSLNNEVAKIICVMKTIIPSNRLKMSVLPGGLKLTPWHPVRIEGKWEFPENVSPAEEMDCPEFYSYVLDKGHTVIINGVECVTLGHGFQGDVVEHEFLGTLAVVKDLAGLKGFEEGMVEITPDYMQRDPKTNRINRIKVPEFIR